MLPLSLTRQAAGKQAVGHTRSVWTDPNEMSDERAIRPCASHRLQAAAVHISQRSQFLQCQGTCLFACLSVCTRLFGRSAVTRTPRLATQPKFQSRSLSLGGASSAIIVYSTRGHGLVRGNDQRSESLCLECVLVCTRVCQTSSRTSQSTQQRNQRANNFGVYATFPT